MARSSEDFQMAAEPWPSRRGTRLTRAVLQSQDPEQAPERIELVSRPFMVFGRYNQSTAKGFGDFALGFVAEYKKISRLQYAVCATDDGLAAMHASSFSASYTGLNDVKLARGHWQRLESKDTLDICGLYQLKVTLAWDLSASEVGMRRESVDIQKLTTQLLEVIDLLKQLEVSTAASVKQRLKESYANLVRMQSQATRLNGADSSGPLLYAQFHRVDASRQVTHIYLPKRLSLGSSQQAGLRVKGNYVASQHAELLFRDGMYWIRNLVEQDEVRVGGYELGPDESLPLEAGDQISLGDAHFIFTGY